jgi:hypothetical protein
MELDATATSPSAPGRQGLLSLYPELPINEGPIPNPTKAESRRLRKAMVKAEKKAKKARRSDTNAMSGIIMSTTSGIKKKTKKGKKAKAKRAQNGVEEVKRATSWSVASGYGNEELGDIKLPASAMSDYDLAAAREKRRLDRAAKKERALIAAAADLIVKVEGERKELELRKNKSDVVEEMDREVDGLQAELREHAERVDMKYVEMREEARRKSKRIMRSLEGNDEEVDKIAAMFGLFGMGRTEGK